MENSNLAVLDSYGDFTERFLDGFKSAETQRKYKTAIVEFFNVKHTWQIKISDIKIVTLVQAKNYVQELIKKYPQGSNVKVKRSALSSLWEQIIGEYEGRVIDKNPWGNIVIENLLKRNLPKSKKIPNVKILSPDDFNNVFDYYRNKNYRDYVLVRTILNGGLRRDEMEMIEEKYFHQEWNIKNEKKEWFLLIPGEESKGKSDRQIFIPDDLYKEIMDVGLSKLKRCGDRINTIVKEGFKEIGIEGITAHQLRHNKATHMLANGASIVDVMKFLGHKVITTTEGYTHVINQYQNNAGKVAVF